MKKLIGVLYLLAACSMAFGATKDVSWTPPTEFVNGDALADIDITKYKLYCSNDGQATFDFYTADIPNTGSVASFTTADVFLGGQFDCYTTAFAIHPGDTTRTELESDPSNTVVFFVNPCDAQDCRPNAPTLLQFSVVIRDGGMELLVAGDRIRLPDGIS